MANGEYNKIAPVIFKNCLQEGHQITRKRTGKNGHFWWQWLV